MQSKQSGKDDRRVSRQVTGTDLVKIALPLDSSEWHGSGAETVWAERLSGEHFRLDNSPFYFFGLSYRDVVAATEDENGQLRFRSVYEHGGHSTYRLMRRAGTEESFAVLWHPLETLGCTYEGGPGRLVSVDVPPEADIHVVYALLEAGEKDGAWDLEEGHCGHHVGDPPEAHLPQR